MATEWKQIIPSRAKHDAYGLRERRLDRGFYHLRMGFSVDPLKDDAWARRNALKYGGFDNPLWQREQELNYGAFAGQRIWPMLSKKAHHEENDISGWTLFRVIDQGLRHPTVCLWVAVNKRGDRHVYREYFSVGRSIGMNCRQILALTSDNEDILYNWIDPSTKKRSAESLTPMIKVFEENGLPCVCADNSFVGYNSVRDALLSTLARKALYTGELPDSLAELKPSQDELLTLAARPALTFDLRFTNKTFEQCQNLRYQQARGDETQTAPREKPVDKDDDGPDCVRYSMQSLLFHRPEESNEIKIIDFKVLSRLNARKKSSQLEMSYARQSRSDYDYRR